LEWIRRPAHGQDWEELTPSQRPAALAFRYESEVQNGGNLQYLINNGAGRGDETVHALKQIGAASQAGVLEEALRRWRAAARLSPADSLEYQAIAGEAEFDALDRDFHACQITLIDVLRHHFAEHKEHFVMYE
jgi:Domain of unknown function (DUF4375)